MISAVIPTHNRLEKLKKTLASAEKQTLAKERFEVLVVDDGSSDGTREFMEKVFSSNKICWRYFFLEHGGPAKARNFGIEKSEGEVVFFCGDDTLWDERLMEWHFNHHQESQSALLGLALWDETEPVSDFMRYLAPAGPQFHYNTIRNRSDAGFDHFYTCNISLKKKWLAQEQFDSRFTLAAFEDIEMGLRLEKRGLKIAYQPEAKVYHSHYFQEETFGQRMENLGRSLVIFVEKYSHQPEVRFRLKLKYAPFWFFPGIKVFVFLSRILGESSLLEKINRRWHWFWRIAFFYSQGILKGLEEKIGKRG